MKMGYNLQLEQSQKLIMTPQLKQAIQILQFNAIELEHYIAEQLEKNPVLEISPEKEHEETLMKKDDDKERKEIDWQEYAEDFDSYGYTKGQYYNEDSEFNYENMVTRDSTLQEHLLFQYHLTLLDKKYNDIGEYIINSLDENGYLPLSVKEIAKDLKKDASIVESILNIIQTFDPPGVGARSLRECLLLQLKASEVKDENLYRIVEDHLTEIADNKYPFIAKQLGVTVQKIQEYCDFIRTLEPKPGRKFAAVQNGYIIPDVVIKKIGEDYVIMTSNYHSPRLIIREDYKKMLSSGNENSEAVSFLSDQFNSAVWLIKSIEQRRQTIYKVAEMIVKKQKSFFEKGKKYLKPMTLKEIADEIDVHESTVSRATNGKYVETPLGTFELKYFFSSGVERFSGEGIASESIKSFIQDIIDDEDPKKPLSDDKIATQLAIKGINISRRTVAKYRDEMGILPSSKRKRY